VPGSSGIQLIKALSVVGGSGCGPIVPVPPIKEFALFVKLEISFLLSAKLEILFFFIIVYFNVNF
jgi:hypothetical protein